MRWLVLPQRAEPDVRCCDRLSGGITGLVVLMVLPFATIFEPLPLAVLGAIVIVAVAGLIRSRLSCGCGVCRCPSGHRMGNVRRDLALAPRLDIAVFIGVGLSIAVFLWRSLQLDIDVDFEDQTLTFTPRGVLWYGTAQRLDTLLVDALAAHPEAQQLVIDLARLGRIDTTGALVLRSVLDEARGAGLAPRCGACPRNRKPWPIEVLKPEKDPIG